MNDTLLAVGADGARGGWLAAVAYGRDDAVARVDLRLGRTFSELVDLRISTAPIAADVPMGLLDHVELRPCDEPAPRPNKS